MKSWGIPAILLILIAALLSGMVWLFVDYSDWLDEQQAKQDKCLAAGGMWIDNRSTENYCFFNK